MLLGRASRLGAPVSDRARFTLQWIVVAAVTVVIEVDSLVDTV